MCKKIALFLSLFSLPGLLHAETIHFKTENYPPFNFTRDGKPTGTAVEQVEALMADTGADYTIETLPWARAYASAESQPMTCVFSTAHTAERNDLFKWVEPLMKGKTLLVKHKGSAVEANDLEEAKKYIVGGWRADASIAILEQKHFPRIDVASDLELTLKKLMSDRIDLMPMAEALFREKEPEGKLEEVAVLSRQDIGIACNRNFPAALLTKMQYHLNALIADGTQAKILQRYGITPQDQTPTGVVNTDH